MLWLSSLNEQKAKVHFFSRACRSSEERDKAAEKAPLSSKPRRRIPNLEKATAVTSIGIQAGMTAEMCEC